MKRLMNALPFVTFSGIGVYVLMHGYLITGILCLLAAFIAAPAVLET
jgi:hypothetical protein